MRIKSAHLAPLAGAILLLGSCTDAPEPVGPAGSAQFSAVAPQGRLPAWFRQASPEVLALPGTVFADHDEVGNLLRFGVEHRGAIPAVRAALARLGIPANAYVIEVTQPIRNLATLRDRWRPTQGGIQIHFWIYVCTLGFNADAGGEQSFITNSHCTRRQGGVQDTEYFQPAQNTDPTVMAVEVEDPDYFRGGACPRGRKCRYSDAARARYSEGVGSTRGQIARTSGPNNGSLEVTGAFTVTSQAGGSSSFAVGTVVNKVGRTTGWTQGGVTATCVDTNVFGTNITQLCQTYVEDPDGAVLVGGGDSGSGVFSLAGGNDVELVGILWGGNSSGTRFVFSPLKNIQDELGALTATQ